MKQVIQNFKSGKLYVDEVPMPALTKGMVLVENKFSLISPGTEKSTVKVAQSNLLSKAKQRPDLVRQVLQNVRKEGLKATFDKVKTKLNTLKALGYSTAGQVLSSMDTNNYFKPGDRVACAGQDYASHAEIITVPQNLIVRIPANVSDEEASFTTLGAIALQGVRQADPKIAEVIAVIGLGLIGQLTCQLLKANGCRVMGIDITDNLLQLAKKTSADEALNRHDENLQTCINNFTKGYGFDSVIITAASSDNDPIELAGEIARRKGKVIVVGATRMDIPREPHFYRKELDLRMSCSYGPGRYDSDYEENGIDYPYAYVRWTEQRNMEAFLQLVDQGKLNIQPLITHRFEIAEAEKAYEIIMGKIDEPHLAILLSYPNNKEKFATNFRLSSLAVQQINVGFIGAGSFAQSYLIPHVKAFGASLQTVMTSTGRSAKNVAEKFGFNNASSSVDDILTDETINTVFIATPHDSHAEYVMSALQAGKNVFVEKPLALNIEELQKLAAVHNMTRGNLMVGFNRRFSPIATAIKPHFPDSIGPLVMNYRVNAGFIPKKDHWIQQPEVGGGRIIGEICHFIDLMQFFANSLPETIFAQCIDLINEKITNADNLQISIKFSNGSIGTIVYVASGDKSFPKEKLEIFGGGKVAMINDFKSAEVFNNGKLTRIKQEGKGHKEEITLFLKSLKKNEPMPISFESLYYTTKATFKILDSLSTGLPQKLDE